MIMGRGLMDSESRNEKVRAVGAALFYLGLGIWLSWRVLGTTMYAFPDGSILNTLIHFLSLALIALSVTCWLREWRLALIGAVAFMLSAVCWANSGNSVLLDTVVIVFASLPRRPRRVIALFLAVTSLVVAITVVSSQLGIIGDYVWLRSNGEEVRHGLGFLYCTFPAHYLFFLTMAYSYLRKGELRLVECALIILLDIYFYLLTDSRNPFLLTLLFVIAIMCLRFKGVRKFFSIGQWRYALCGLFVIFAVLSATASLAFDSANPLWATANDVLSGRLIQTNASINRYGVKLFGQEIDLAGNGLVAQADGTFRVEEDGVDTNFVDNAYMSSLIHSGVVSTLLILAMMTAICWHAVTHKDPTLLIISVFIAVHALVDPQALELNYNAFLLVAAMPLKELYSGGDI